MSQSLMKFVDVEVVGFMVGLLDRRAESALNLTLREGRSQVPSVTNPPGLRRAHSPVGPVETGRSGPCSAVRFHRPYGAAPTVRRNSRATSPGSRCLPSTSWFSRRIVSAVILPASRSSAARTSGWRRSVSLRTSGTAS